MVEGDARRFGEIDLIARLGQGGMAEVFLASRRAKPAELLVLKRLKEDLNDPEHRSMFEDESRIMPLFNHPNIVRTVAAGEEDGRKYLAMEFLDGLPLDQCMEAVRELGQRAAIHVVCELLEGLHYAHELHGSEGQSLDLVHRDVSPHNVFITYEGRVTLVDFGIAKSKARANHTATGVVRGKLSYMAPEQALCDSVDRRADVFSVGVILWELLARRRFWEGQSDVQILKRMTFGELPQLEDTGIEGSAAVREVLRMALAAKPEERFATARAFREALVALGDGAFKRLELGRAVSDAAQGYREALQEVVVAHLERARGTDGLFAPPSSSSGERKSATANTNVEPTRADESSVARSAAVELPQPLPPAPPALRHEHEVEPITDVSITRAASVSPARRGGGVAMVVAMAALLVAGAVSLKLFSRRTETSPSTTSATTTSEQRVELKIDVSTPGATAVFDGTEVSLPFVGTFPRGVLTRRLEVRAPGYMPRSLVVVLDRDVALAIALEKEAPLPSTASAAASASSAPTVRGPARPNAPPSSTATSKPTSSSGFDYRTPPWGASKKPR